MALIYLTGVNTCSIILQQYLHLDIPRLGIQNTSTMLFMISLVLPQTDEFQSSVASLFGIQVHSIEQHHHSLSITALLRIQNLHFHTRANRWFSIQFLKYPCNGLWFKGTLHGRFVCGVCNPQRVWLSLSQHPYWKWPAVQETCFSNDSAKASVKHYSYCPIWIIISRITTCMVTWSL